MSPASLLDGDLPTMPGGTTLILSVDRDDDIGFKGRIETPILGRDACLKAANALALVDPEDSDLNAIFQAVKMYDQLHQRGEMVEIAILSGDHGDMLAGDRKIASDLDGVVRSTHAVSCILVTDGAEDEYVLPIIQSRIPVSNVRRVVVTQIPNLESTYYTVKKLFDDPKIARVTLVPLGLAMLLFAIAYLLGYPEGATIIVFGIVGVYLLFKGFAVDDLLRYLFGSLVSSLRYGRFTFFTYSAAIVIIVIGSVVGLTTVLEYYPTGETLGLFLVLVSFLYGSLGWFVLAGLILSGGKLIDSYLNDREELGRIIVLPFFVSAIGLIAFGACIYTLSLSALPSFPYPPSRGLLYLAGTIGGGLFCSVTGLYVQTMVRRKATGDVQTVV